MMKQERKGFEILPAIDLRAGHVVRLRQGDFAQETAYAEDPVAVARTFVDGGASWLHVVDLDGARDGRPSHLDDVARILAAVRGRAAVEVAGGLRTAEDVSRMLDLGVDRVVIGTAALLEAGFAAGLVKTYGSHTVVVALDVREELAVGSGWVRGADAVRLDHALERLASSGVECFEVTAVLRDGTLEGPDTALLGRVVANGRARIIAAGGIATVDDVQAVRDLGCAGAIIGRAFYDGTLDLGSALRAAGSR